MDYLYFSTKDIRYQTNQNSERMEIYKEQESPKEKENDDLMVMMNMSNFNYSVYNLKGIKLGKISFKDHFKGHKFGHPLAVSNDGLKYVFGTIKKCDEDSSKINEITLHILKLTIDVAKIKQ